MFILFFVTSLSFATRDHTYSFDEFQYELLSHDIFLNQHLASSPSPADAMFTHKSPTPFNNKK